MATPQPTEQRSIFITLADGLEASTDGRGWGAEHERAKDLAEASPAMYAALGNLLKMVEDGDVTTIELDEARAALALVDSPPEGPPPTKQGQRLHKAVTSRIKTTERAAEIEQVLTRYLNDLHERRRAIETFDADPEGDSQQARKDIAYITKLRDELRAPSVLQTVTA